MDSDFFVLTRSACIPIHQISEPGTFSKTLRPLRTTFLGIGNPPPEWDPTKVGTKRHQNPAPAHIWGGLLFEILLYKVIDFMVPGGRLDPHTLAVRGS
jgi:hypothetical protein